jgi:Fe-S-cluster containining protein
MQVSRAQLHEAATALREEAAASLVSGCCSPAACSALCRRVNRALEDQLARVRDAGIAVACEAGCDFCCHQRVSVLPHEAIALFLGLQALPPTQRGDIERRIVANAGRVDRMSVAEHVAANLPCGFLEAGRCSVYEARPSICASFHSLRRERCEHAFTHPHDNGTPRNSRPASLEVQVLADALHAATHAACEQAGKDHAKLELHQALRALLAEPRSIERWCAGEMLAGALERTEE